MTARDALDRDVVAHGATFSPLKFTCYNP